MLGILIGVAAVVAMIALGAGAQKTIETQLASLGSNLLVLSTGAMRVGGVYQEAGSNAKLTVEDANAIHEQVPGVKSTSPAVTGRVQLTYGNKNWNTQVTGALPIYEVMKNSTPQVGRFFSVSDNAERARVAVIGVTIVRELFGKTNPIGETIKINRTNFQVVGVLPEKGSSGWRNQDDVVVVRSTRPCIGSWGSYTSTPSTSRSWTRRNGRGHRLPPRIPLYPKGESPYLSRKTPTT